MWRAASNVFSLTWLKPPAPPANLTAKREDSKIMLSWERREWALLQRVSLGKTPYIPSSREPRPPCRVSVYRLTPERKTYKYEVRAVRVENGVPRRGRAPGLGDTQKKTPPAPPERARGWRRKTAPSSSSGRQTRRVTRRVQRLPGCRGKGEEDQRRISLRSPGSRTTGPAPTVTFLTT